MFVLYMLVAKVSSNCYFKLTDLDIGIYYTCFTIIFLSPHFYYSKNLECLKNLNGEIDIYNLFC